MALKQQPGQLILPLEGRLGPDQKRRGERGRLTARRERVLEPEAPPLAPIEVNPHKSQTVMETIRFSVGEAAHEGLKEGVKKLVAGLIFSAALILGTYALMKISQWRVGEEKAPSSLRSGGWVTTVHREK